MFGSRPKKIDPEIDKLIFWFTLIGPILGQVCLTRDQIWAKFDQVGPQGKTIGSICVGLVGLVGLVG